MLREELLAGRMRQLWGAPGCDLRLGSNNFENNIQGQSEDYDKLNDSKRRYRILSLLLRIKPGDIIIVPKVSCTQEGIGPYFTIAECVQPYTFDPLPQLQDGGHIIGVKILGTWNYSSTNENANAVGKILKTFALGKAVNRILNSETIQAVDNLIAILPPNENSLNLMMKKMLAMQEDYLTELLKVLRNLPNDNPVWRDCLKRIHDVFRMLPPDTLKKIIKELFTKNGCRLIEDEPDFVFELAENDTMLYVLTEQKKIFVHVNHSPKLAAPDGNIHIVIDLTGTLEKSEGIIFVDEETFISILARYKV